MKTYNIWVENLLIKLFALKNLKINVYEDDSRAFNILHSNIFLLEIHGCVHSLSLYLVG